LLLPESTSVPLPVLVKPDEPLITPEMLSVLADIVETVTPELLSASGTAMEWFPLLTAITAAALGPLSSDKVALTPEMRLYLYAALSKLMAPTVFVPSMVIALSAAGVMPVPK